MIEKSPAVKNKNVRLIAVSGEQAKDAARLLTKILRTCNFRVSQISSCESAWMEALSIAGNVCDFVVFNTDSFDVEFPKRILPETALVLKGFELTSEKDFEKYTNVVLPYSLYESITNKNNNMLFYSMNNNEADLIAKNINPQEERTVFELLGTGVIGRVKLSKSSELSVELVLAVSSALISMGVPLASVLNVMNQL